MTRTTARMHAMKLIYEWEMGGDGGDDTRFGLLEVQPDEEEADYMNETFAGVVANVDSLDAVIERYAKGWKLDRITRVDLAILRLGVYELLQKKDNPGAILSEAVYMANIFSGEKAGAFVNGVLGSVAREEN